MPDAYIYDHIRTPRGKGRPDGGLHSVSPVELLAQVLRHLRDRNELDTKLIEDVIAGCGSPIGEQGSAIGRSACLAADYASSVPGQQIHRFWREEFGFRRGGEPQKAHAFCVTFTLAEE